MKNKNECNHIFGLTKQAQEILKKKPCYLCAKKKKKSFRFENEVEIIH